MRKNCAIKALPFFWRRNEKAEAQDVWSRGRGSGRFYASGPNSAQRESPSKQNSTCHNRFNFLNPSVPPPLTSLTLSLFSPHSD